MAASGGSSNGSKDSAFGLSIRDLCRFYLQYSESSVWNEICDVWQTAVDLVCQQQGQQQQQQQQQLAQDEGQAGSKPMLNQPSNCSNHNTCADHAGIAAEEAPSGSSIQSSPNSNDTNYSNRKGNSNAISFNFVDLMTRHVRGLTRKPVRVKCGVHELLLCADLAAALAAVRDFCERSTREWAENAKG